ncbi:MAG: HD domain-containing phosphohydrolase [Terriglobales bacterium]
MILGVLVMVSVVPMYFYSTRVVAINRERLKVNEQLLENELTRSLAEDIAQRDKNLGIMLANFTTAVEVTSGGRLDGDSISSPQLKALLEKFVTSSKDLASASLVNAESKGISAGRVQPDLFMQKEMERAFVAAREHRNYHGQPLSVGSGQDSRTVMLTATPIVLDGQFVGLTAVFVDLGFLIERLKANSQGGMVAYVVDHQGRLVAGASPEFATGQDMTVMEIVKNFVDQGGNVQFSPTLEFNAPGPKKKMVRMLGTYASVPSLHWAVIAQKALSDAYADVYAMQWTARLLAVLSVLVSMIISIWAARGITRPLEVLNETSHAIGKGDFSQRADVTSRTEIGELASTFNLMAESLEKFIADLKRAAEENRALFLSSIQMLAGAVDEKDPYTRGHSDRVTRYSVVIAREMGLPEEEVEKVRVAAQLHDVGKIGIEDRVLKKPGALTPEEYELMKAHTTKGANILRPVQQLTDMIPGIELHHESLDGRGYPYGLKGEEVPVMARIIMVADTFDAMTTNRPYQSAMDPEYVIRIINSLAGNKFDPKVVSALTAVFERGDVLPRAAAAATAGAS